MSDTDQVQTEILRRIFWDGVPLTVGPDPDGLGFVRLYADGADAKKHYGDIELILNPELARQVGEALIAAAKEAQP